MGPMVGSAAPLFSVVVPTHQRPDRLAVAVASILAQRIDDLEVIVVDDASPEPPAPFDDPRVRIVVRPVNGGPGAARNTGAAAARGRYLAFLDDDDRWTPDRLDLALEGLARAPLALCWARFADEPPAPRPVLDGWVGDRILDEVTPPFDALALDRDLFVPLDERYRGSEDVAWWLAMAQRHPVATVPVFGVLVGRHAGGRDAAGERARLDGGLRLLREQHAWFAAHPRARAMRWQRVGLTAARAGEVPLARLAFARSFRARPRVRPLVHLARTFRPGSDR